jgi:polyferredoxin
MRAVALFVFLVAGTALRAQPSTPPPDDPWHFAEDEEQALPTWRQIVAGQAVDLTLFSAFAGVALVSFFRKSERLKLVTFVMSIVYLGFFRSQILSVVNVFGLVSWNLPILRYNAAWYLFAVFAVASTVLWGRFYCGRVCAFGSLTQLMDRFVPARLRIDVPKPLERRAAAVKYVILGGAVAYFLVTRETSFYRYIEPFWMFTRQGTTGMWIGLGVLLVATVFVRNLYCRFLCPVGAFLGLLSNLTVFRIKRWSECNTCKICQKTCEWGAIRGPKIIASECVRCDDCERLYMDTQVCPHWIIIRRKSDLMARRPAAPIRRGDSRVLTR